MTRSSSSARQTTSRHGCHTSQSLRVVRKSFVERVRLWRHLHVQRVCVFRGGVRIIIITFSAHLRVHASTYVATCWSRHKPWSIIIIVRLIHETHFPAATLTWEGPSFSAWVTNRSEPCCEATLSRISSLEEARLLRARNTAPHRHSNWTRWSCTQGHNWDSDIWVLLQVILKGHRPKSYWHCISTNTIENYRSTCFTNNHRSTCVKNYF